MAVLVFKDANVVINGVNLSDHVRNVSLSYSAELLDKTVMGNNSRAKIAGLKDSNVSIEFAHDFAAGEVDATLFGLVGSTDIQINLRPTSSGVSATNPTFKGQFVLETYPIFSNTVGEFAVTTVTFQGTGDLTRSTTST